MESLLTDMATVFVLVLARVGALVATAPIVSETTIPMRIKALLAVMMAAVITPLCLHHPSPEMANIAELGAAMGAEAIIGLALGLGVMVILAGVQLTGQIVGQLSGMAMAEGADPAFGSNASIFGQIFMFVTIAVFVAAGGHTLLIESLLKTFDHTPPGYATFNPALAHEFLGLLSIGFELGVRSSAPLMIALFLATLVLGLISRTLPQINTIVVGFGVNSMLTLGLMMISVGAVAWSFQGPLTATIENLTAAVTSAPVP